MKTNNLFEHLCRQSPLNLPDNVREPYEPGIDECQDSDPLGSLDQFLSTVTAKPIADPLDAFLSSVSTKPVPSKQTVQEPERFIMCYWPNGCVRPSPRFLAEQKAKAGLTKDTGCTFEEWKELGYWIKKGSKSMFKSPLGEPLFTIEQVTPPR